ncbi:MAG: FAD-binding oxidoreductase [Thermodesulfobacteriota bacterium]
MPGTSIPAAIVGEDRLGSADDMASFSGDCSPARPMQPCGVVKPHSADEVRRIVLWANETRTPLIPVSSGLPHFHGDTVPGTGGAWILDLSHMKRILRIDRRNRNAMIEPGVTFGELIPALASQALAPLIPRTPRAAKSVVAAFLERTPITAPRHHWEPQDPLQCVEVIYGNGDLMRTGSAAGPGTLEEQWKVGRAQVRGMGPSQVDFTRLLQGAQGSMGIVTWATIRCRPLPRVRKAFLAAGTDIEPLIELAYRITYKKLGEDLLILSGTELARMLGMESPSPRAAGPRLPPWILYLGIDGDGLFPEDKVAYQEREAARLAGGLGLSLVDEVPGLPADELAALLSRPSREPCGTIDRKGGLRDILFLTTLDRSPEFIREMREQARRAGFPWDRVGVYLQPILQGCNAHLEFGLTYDPGDLNEKDAAERLVREGAEAMAALGGFFSRPYGDWSRFAFDPEGMHVSALRKLKAIFDPDGILNPGKLCF